MAHDQESRDTLQIVNHLVFWNTWVVDWLEGADPPISAA